MHPRTENEKRNVYPRNRTPFIGIIPNGIKAAIIRMCPVYRFSLHYFQIEDRVIGVLDIYTSRNSFIVMH